MIEIGKRDLIGNGALSLAPFAYNRSLISIDLAEVMENQPDQCRRQVHLDIAYYGKFSNIEADSSSNLLPSLSRARFSQSIPCASSAQCRLNRRFGTCKQASTWAR